MAKQKESVVEKLKRQMDHLWKKWRRVQKEVGRESWDS